MGHIIQKTLDPVVAHAGGADDAQSSRFVPLNVVLGHDHGAFLHVLDPVLMADLDDDFLLGGEFLEHPA